MSRTGKTMLSTAALSLLLATLLGAIGSHGLRATLEPSVWEAYQTALQYQFHHSIALLGIVLLAERHPGARSLRLSALALLCGIVLFCGSIYATTLGAPQALGRAAPFGGLAFMLGWLALALAPWLPSTTSRTGAAAS